MENLNTAGNSSPVTEVTRIEIVPFRPTQGFVGFASCVLNRCFYLGDIALFTRPYGGLRLGYPIKKLSNGSTLELFKVLDKHIDESIEQAITKEYESLMNSTRTEKENTNEYIRSNEQHQSH